MKKTDILIAFVLGLLVSAAAVWFAQPKWYKDLSEEIRQWREPRRRPSMNRYIERDRMRREERESRNSSDVSPSRLARYTEGMPSVHLKFSVVDAITFEGIRTFQYRRYFRSMPSEQQNEEMEWIAGGNLPEIRIHTKRTYTPARLPNQGRDIAQTELWRIVIEDQLRRTTAESDTLEVKADGYQLASLSLFDLIHAENPVSDWQEIRLLPIGATEKDVELAAQQRKVKEAAAQEQGLAFIQRRLAQEAMSRNQSPTVKEEASLFGAIALGGEVPINGLVRVHSTGAAAYHETELAAGGVYEIAELSPGDCVITVRATIDGVNWREHRESITLKSGEATQFNYDFISFGTLVGTVTGLHEGESGGIFAIKGDYALSNVTEDDLYDFGEICEGEARPNKEGIFTIRELEEGKYTIIAIAERHTIGEDPSFLYVTDTVEIKAGEEANISLSLN